MIVVVKKMSSNNPIDKRIQNQIDHLNKNLKKEIDDRLGADDRYRLACYYLDQRIGKLEKKKLFMKEEEEGPNKLAHNNSKIIIWILILVLMSMLIAGIVLSTSVNTQ